MNLPLLEKKLVGQTRNSRALPSLGGWGGGWCWGGGGGVGGGWVGVVWGWGGGK